MNDMVFWTYTTLFVGHTAFLTAAFFAAAFSCCALAALTAPPLFVLPARILAKPSLLIRRLGFGASALAGGGGSDSPRILAHRRCWASFMRFLADRKST